MTLVITLRVVLAITITILLIFLVWVQLLQKPTVGAGCPPGWDPTCNWVEEYAYDSSLKSPEGISPVLTSFTDGGSSVGPPLYLPIWYRFRYVNADNGGYSKFSDWTTSPVMAGQSSSTCTYNQPIIGVAKTDAAYQPGDGNISMNLHRYVGKPGESSPPRDTKDEIVGTLTIPSGKYFTWVDVSNNPCLTMDCPTPHLCET